MKKIVLLLAGMIANMVFIFAQDLHSPAEIMKIMEESELTYSIAELTEEIPVPDNSSNLNYNNVYKYDSAGNVLISVYNISEEAEQIAIEAESFFSKGKTKEAREKYLEALEKDPGYYSVMTYIGQTYGIEEDYNSAKEWYKKVIEKNYIDYMAHWFLADIYIKTGEKKLAVMEITIANILNRNNPRIRFAMENIYKKNRLKVPDWVFNPQCRITFDDIDEVTIEYSNEWLGYSLYKAVWSYEPGYRSSMGIVSEFTSTLEEKECLVGLITNISINKKSKKKPVFKALNKALDNQMIDEFILYEILLPQYPYVAYQLPEEAIKLVVEYVVQVRGGKKMKFE